MALKVNLLLKLNPPGIGDLSIAWLSWLEPFVFWSLRVFKYLALSVPDEGYSRKASCALNLISTFLLMHVYINVDCTSCFII